MRIEEVGLLKFGNTIQLAGAVYAGEGLLFLAMFPEDRSLIKGDYRYGEDMGPSLVILDMDEEDWQVFLRQTDLMEVEVLTKASDGTLAKAIVRKSARQIDQGVSWRVFKRDGYACCYCGNDSTPLTIDHLITWESMGPTTEANLLSACRKCNKTRGETEYGAWLLHPYYLEVSKKLTPARRAANEALVATLSAIPLRVNQKSR
jgi:hypothetical protein